MNLNDVIFMSLNSRVIALNKGNGQILWDTKLGGVLGDRFITLNSDGQHVFAFCKGQIYCLNVSSGNIVWTNELKGYGYGIASICIPGFPTAPDPAAYAKIQSDRRSSSSSDTPSTT